MKYYKNKLNGYIVKVFDKGNKRMVYRNVYGEWVLIYSAPGNLSPSYWKELTEKEVFIEML